jgi:hypothetical protein
VFDLEVHRLRLRAEVTSPLRLPPASGAALRGALFAALRAQFCLAESRMGCGLPDLAASCPVCFLLAPVDEGNLRGRDVPRPYVLHAPTAPAPTYAPGEVLEFGLSTFGHALDAFPYALRGVQEMGQRGLGAQRRGGFRLTEIWAENPLAGRQERIYRAADGAVRTPSLPIAAEDVAAEAATLGARLGQPGDGAQRVRLALRTPTRLIERGHLVKPEAFRPRTLLARLLERLDALGGRYGGGPTGVEPAALLRHAEAVRIVERRLGWRDLFRGSGRHHAQLPMGGLVGNVVLEGDLGPLLPWLVWGTLVHAGKDAAMGNGELRVEALDGVGP